MTTNRPLRVFLCHSSNDKPAVRELYQKLRAEPWIQPWLDEEELYPGDDWDLAIEKAVENSDVVLVCLSNGSINKRGYVQKELRFALDIALEMPEETIFIIPLRLEECTPPRSLRDWQYADYFEGQHERAFDRLLISLKRRADSLNLDIENIELSKIPGPSSHSNEKIEMLTNTLLKLQTKSSLNQNKIILSNGMEFMYIPAGKFLMGSTKENEAAFADELMQHYVDIVYDYWMAKFPVTNGLYNEFVKAQDGCHPVVNWQDKKDHPVVRISWDSAMIYCRWLNALLRKELPSGLILRLPTEAEWEKSARGIDGREYPWGNEFEVNRCNTKESNIENTVAVGSYSPAGDSPYSCVDMAGNVWEWTHSLKKNYPYNHGDGREIEDKHGTHVLRGGSHLLDSRYSRCSSRFVNFGSAFLSFSFRVCLAPSLQV